jgi:hypothetical protein
MTVCSVLEKAFNVSVERLERDVADIAGMDVLGVDVLRASFQRSGAGRSASTDLSAGNFPNGFSFPGLFCRRGTMVAKSKSRWSGEVTQHSDALDLEKDIFESNNPDAIAKSLKHSAETSDRRKSSPYRSAMSMLTFYINRAGKNLSKPRRHTLEQAKTSLRKIFHRNEA